MVDTRFCGFKPRLPHKFTRKKGVTKGGLCRKSKVILRRLPYGLTDEHIPVLIDYHTLRSLAYKNMGLRLSCPSHYKIFRVGAWGLSVDRNLNMFEMRWKELTVCSGQCWPGAVDLMNSLSLAYIEGEYDPHFKKVLLMDREEIDHLIKYMSLILQKVHRVA